MSEDERSERDERAAADGDLDADEGRAADAGDDSGARGASGPAGAADPSGLSERDMSVLAVERLGWSGPGAKERAIRERLEMSPTRYYQLLNALLDDPRALAHDPVTVNRLRRNREARRVRRTGGTSPAGGSAGGS